MTTRSRFNNSRPIHITPQNLHPFNYFDLRGLDMYSPDEIADDRRCVYGRNFRLFAPSDTSKRVALSKRFGHAFYTVPVGEAVDQQLTSVTGAADQSATLTTWLAQKETAGASGQLTKIDIRLKNDASGTGPAIVAIYSDSSGSPGSLLATSSVLSSSITSSYQYLSARFIEAPTVVSGTAYWVVSYIQADGTNNYKWSSNTSATTAKSSVDSGTTWSATSYQLNLKTYISTAGAVKGVHRFYRSNGSPVTLFAQISDVYSVNDGTGAVTSIKGSLSGSATTYDFQSVNDITYYVNGVDAPRKWDGTTEAVAGGSPPTAADNVELHVNRLFYLEANTNRCVFTDAADYETIQATSFIYIPSPKTADSTVKMLSFQGNMTFLTRNTKWVLYGTDLTSFTLRESPAKKGAVSATAICKDENFVYFLNDDGLIYRYNGGTDEPINAQRVWPILKNVASTSAIYLYIRDKKLFVSYRSSGLSNNNHRLVYDLVYNEWLSDEETYTNYGISLSSQSDTNQNVVGSSIVGALYYAETGTNDVGKPIKFDWRSKYFSFGTPAAKHRVKRYYAFLRSQTTNHTIDCQVDTDEANAPASNLINVSQGGSLWGTAVWGSFTWGSQTFLRNRISVPGANYKHQFRFSQSGVDNKVDILGMSLYIQPRRPT